MLQVEGKCEFLTNNHSSGLSLFNTIIILKLPVSFLIELAVVLLCSRTIIQYLERLCQLISYVGSPFPLTDGLCAHINLQDGASYPFGIGV